MCLNWTALLIKMSVVRDVCQNYVCFSTCYYMTCLSLELFVAGYIRHAVLCRRVGRVTSVVSNIF